MPKILLAVAAIAVVSAVFIFTRQATPKSTQTDPSTQVQSSSYFDYSPAAYTAAADKKRVLYFYATWCPTCGVANQDFTVNAAQIPPDVVIFRTDYDRETTLKTKYGVTYQHTFVQVDKNGNELAKWNGGGLPELLRNLK